MPIESGQQVPEFSLPHIGGGSVSSGDYRGRPYILAFGGRKTAGEVERLVEAVRERHRADQVPIVQIVTLKGVPLIVHGLAKRDVRSGYEKQARQEAARLRELGEPVPEDLSSSVIILLDREGVLVDGLGISGLERASVAVLVDGGGRVRASGSGPEAAPPILAALASP